MTEVNLQDLYSSFINSADFYPGENEETRQKMAQIEAQQRLRQHKNNERALSISNASNLEMLNKFLNVYKQMSGVMPPRPGLIWNPRTHRWIRPEQNKYETTMDKYEKYAKLSRDYANKLREAQNLYHTGKLSAIKFSQLMTEYNQIVEARNKAKRDIDMYKSILASK